MTNRSEISCIMNYYYGRTELQEIGYNELKSLYDNVNISKIYGVYEDLENDAWYLVCTKKGKSKIVPKKRGEIEGCRIIQPFKDKFEFIHIRPDLIKKFARNIYPLFYKNDEIDTDKKIDCQEYLEKSNYPFCYAKYGKDFLVFSKHKDSLVMNKVETEEEAILCLLIASESENKIIDRDLFMFVVDNRNYNRELNEVLNL